MDSLLSARAIETATSEKAHRSQRRGRRRHILVSPARVRSRRKWVSWPTAATSERLRLGSAEPVRRKFNSFKDKLQPQLTSDPHKYDFVTTASPVSKLDGTLDEKADGLVKEWKRVTILGVPVVSITDIPR